MSGNGSERLPWEFRPLKDAFGAEVVDVDLKRLKPADAVALMDGLDRFNALVVRGQDLAPADLTAFSRRFGDLDEAPIMERGRTTVPGHSNVYVVSNVAGPDGEPIGSLGSGEAVWHTDMSHVEHPPYASLLYAVETPETGGDTWLASMRAAFHALPRDIEQRVLSLSIKHDAAYNSGGYLRQGASPSDNPVTSPGAVHPAVIRHPRTFEPSLYLGRRRGAHIVGLDLAESEELLDLLWSYAMKVEHCYRHHWRPGDLLIWDNLMTIHRRDAFDPSARRILHRTQICGPGDLIPWVASAQTTG